MSKKSKNSLEEFAPYSRFIENMTLTTKHLSATETAYALAVATFSDPKIKGERITDSSNLKLITNSYTRADLSVSVVEPTRQWGWIPLQEFANLENMTLDEVTAEARAGKLGKVSIHPETNEEIVIWPREKQGTKEAEALETGLRVYRVQVRRSKTAKEILRFDADNKDYLEEIRHHIVHIGREPGEPAAIFSEAKELMWRSAFINIWSTFESFIRETFAELITRFPAGLSNLPEGRKATISYKMLVENTN